LTITRQLLDVLTSTGIIPYKKTEKRMYKNQTTLFREIQEQAETNHIIIIITKNRFA